MEQTDKELRYWALHFWANYIETGKPTFSAKDAIERGILPNALDEGQLKTVARIRELAMAELRNG